MTIWNGAWHPVAERFPMLSEEELRRLAESITETGQLHACLMGPDGLGLDGRNRVAACKIIGAEPQWAVTEADPVGVIIAGNVRHRHMTVGQQAMAAAIGMEAQELESARESDKRAAAESASRDGARLLRDLMARQGVRTTEDLQPDAGGDAT